MYPIVISSDSESESNHLTLNNPRYYVSIDPGQLNIGISIFDINIKRFVYLRIHSIHAAVNYNRKEISREIINLINNLLNEFNQSQIKIVLIEKQMSGGGNRFNQAILKNALVEMGILSVSWN